MLALIVACWLILQVAPHESAASAASAAPAHAAPTYQTPQIPTGQIVDRVVCADDSSQSYAVYLPSTYSPDRKWPVLYAFDPRARGRLPLEAFKEAAEQFKWIVVGSNNSRNGPFQVSVDAWNAIVKDTHARFTIDDRRVYTAGFSGGARAAIYLATRCEDCISGVIACGAGFPAGITPSPTMHFAVFNTIGVDDYNLPEATELDDALARASIEHWIERFDGRHEWAPSTVAVGAVEWLELKAMRAGTRTRDIGLIAAIRQKSLDRARALEEAKKTYEAYHVYGFAADAFTGLLDAGDINKKVNQLRDSRAVTDGIRNEQRQIRKQQELEAQIRDLIVQAERSRAQESVSEQEGPGREPAGDGPFESETRLRLLLADLRKQSASVEDSGTRRIARRVVEGMFISLYEQGLDALQGQKLYARAVRTFTLVTVLFPDRGSALYCLAWAHAANGDRRQALQALKSAIDKGFSDLSAITGNKAFDSIRRDPQFEQLVLRLGNPR